VWKAGEIYLELEAVDLDEEEAILVFANRFGTLGVSSEDYRLFRQLPWYRDVVQRLQGTTPPTSEAIHPYFGGWRPIAEAEAVREFQFGARVLRDLRRAWSCIRDGSRGGISFESTQGPLERSADESLVTAPDALAVWGSPDPLRATAHFLEQTLTSGLSVFHPKVTLTAPSKRPAHGWMSGATVPLFSTCCLELFNHMVEDATYRRCENDRCGRVFVRQKGRSEVGQHRRTGIMYCSNTCARAVAQRRYRERQARRKK
jgi:hypothetical protein